MGEYRDDGTFVAGLVYTPPTPPSWKSDLLALHDKQVNGTMTAAEAANFNAILAAQGLDPLDTLPDATASGTLTTLALAVSASLTETQKPQLESNWCGPASAHSVVLSWHAEKGSPTTSAWDGTALSQARLATSTYTNAGSSGGTDWIHDDMTRALNRWLFDGGTAYVQWSPDSTSSLKSKVTLDIDIDWMVASDMHEKAGGNHYNHHPDKDISHWTTIYGYAESGGTFRFQDPAANSPALSSAWDNVNPYFSMSASSTYSYMVKQGLIRGIAW
jgi:hypothetical protein